MSEDNKKDLLATSMSRQSIKKHTRGGRCHKSNQPHISIYNQI